MRLNTLLYGCQLVASSEQALGNKKKRITIRAIESLSPGQIFWDTELNGFGVRSRATGKFYFLKARINGRQRWFTIGKHGAPWTPDTARKRALKVLAKIADGEDPAAAREELKEKVTVEDVCELYLRDGISHKAASTIETDKGRIKRHIIPLLGKRAIRSVTKTDIVNFVHDVSVGKTATDERTGKKRGRAIVTGGQGTASRTTGLLGGIFSFAQERGLLETNPVLGVKRPKSKRIERFLHDDELVRFSNALSELEMEEEISVFAAAAIRLLLFTGARKGEILGLKWEWVDFNRGQINLPQSKTGAKVIFLSAPALEILNDLPRLNDNPFVICGYKDGEHLRDLKRPWDKLLRKSKIENLRIHDLRHHFASVGAMRGLSLPMIGKLLGHKNPETTARYSHFAPDPIRDANEQIADKISRSMEPRERKSNVISISSKSYE